MDFLFLFRWFSNVFPIDFQCFFQCVFLWNSFFPMDSQCFVRALSRGLSVPYPGAPDRTSHVLRPTSHVPRPTSHIVHSCGGFFGRVILSLGYPGGLSWIRQNLRYCLQIALSCLVRVLHFPLSRSKNASYGGLSNIFRWSVSITYSNMQPLIRLAYMITFKK